MKTNLTQKIFIGFILGAILCIILNILNLPFNLDKNLLILLSFGGDIFLKTIKMLVVPIVFFSLVNGVSNLKNIASLGRSAPRQGQQSEPQFFECLVSVPKAESGEQESSFAAPHGTAGAAE